MARGSTSVMPLVTSDRSAQQQEIRLRRHGRPASTGRRGWLLGLLLILVATVAVSSVRVPAGAAAGTEFHRPVEAPSYTASAGTAPGEIQAGRPTFRVGIFNIHGGRGRDNNRDLTRTANCLRKLDIVGLNEVLGPKLWWQTDQAQQLGEILELAWLYAPTESRWWDGSFGNGLLSALPVRSWQRIPLPRGGAHTYRNIVLSTVELGGQSVRVLLTHLDSRDNSRRQEQLRTAGDLFLALREPAILMGDLNTAPDDSQLTRLLAAPGVIDAFAASAPEVPAHRIDWILARGLQSVDAGCDASGASDHPLFWAELQIAD
jgi:endonuclease/exonuclease/phosphatase family metal-dependent hydrolase